MYMPKNGLYLTAEDNLEFTDYLGKLYTKSGLKSCSTCSKRCECGSHADLKVKNVTFVVTEACNLACTYCYEKHKTNRVMSKEIAKQAVDFLFDKEKLNGYYDPDSEFGIILDFIGGETLLEIDLINYIVEYFKFKAFEMGHQWATNYRISISSNGILYDTPAVRDFVAKNKDNLSFTISIDGCKELHDACRVFHDGRGSYDIVEKSSKMLIQDMGHFGTSTKMTLAPSNISYLYDAVRNLYENIGLHIVYSNCVYEEGWEFKHSVELYNQMIKVADYIIDNDLYSDLYVSLFNEDINRRNVDNNSYCGGNGDMLAIGTDGKCYPCLRFMDYALTYQEEQCIGDIFKGIDGYENNPWLKKLEAVTFTSQSPQKCIDCPVSGECGLCTAYNYDKFGDPDKRATFICDMHKARVCANSYFWNKLYKKLGVDKKFELSIENVYESR